MDAILDGREWRVYIGGIVSYRLASGVECQKRFLQSIGGPDFAAALKLVQESGRARLNWEYAPKYNETNKECE
jgi:hypothetical protein